MININNQLLLLPMLHIIMTISTTVDTTTIIDNYYCNGETHLACVSDRNCIPHMWLCDGDNDCDDKSDEQCCIRTNNIDDRSKRCNDDNMTSLSNATLCLNGGKCIKTIDNVGQIIALNCSCRPRFIGSFCKIMIKQNTTSPIFYRLSIISMSMVLVIAIVFIVVCWRHRRQAVDFVSRMQLHIATNKQFPADRNHIDADLESYSILSRRYSDDAD